MIGLYNLMPHECTVFSDDGVLRVPSLGELRLLSLSQRDEGKLDLISLVSPQQFTGLDPASKGYAAFQQHKGEVGAGFIVSAVTAEWLVAHDQGGRYGLYAPATGPAYAVRDKDGRIVGCKALELHRAPRIVVA